jgi:molybdopterin-binding protein
MKLSARNVFKGKVLDVDKGQVTAIVRVDIGGSNIITSSITLASANELGVQQGSDITVIIKSSDVILGVGN